MLVGLVFSFLLVYVCCIYICIFLSLCTRNKVCIDVFSYSLGWGYSVLDGLIGGCWFLMGGTVVSNNISVVHSLGSASH